MSEESHIEVEEKECKKCEDHESHWRNNKRWSALDPEACHPMDNNGGSPTQGASQVNKTLQLSEEFILIKDSCDVTVNSTDTKAALSLQASLQTAIALVISISIADSEKADKITQELLQSSKIKQLNYQKTVVENSKNVDVTTTDTQIAVNIQLLLQILLALLVRLDIL
ncbi:MULTISPECIES: spore coat protein [Shouchella]|uniref:Spore coat protein n=2 Tax=Shouchella TaxID=2893057 RepID=A0ABY7W851_9BACI|nr:MULTISPECIES: spore coat protein [Shouchella]MED4127207.1 spore coat protein [Shouchella miscanthi]WDF03686.1 spore coat protein [Shouchella hunanensis]GAF23507.1 spore coat protein X [Bacillus sp. JCM 19047]